ncbi:4Fe-4S binding protein [Aeromonas caviae]
MQLYSEDCTGCGQCVQACPVRAGADARHQGERAIAMMDKAPHLAGQKQALRWFESLPWPPASEWISPPCAVPSSWSPCSSSPVPAPAVARRPISSC